MKLLRGLLSIGVSAFLCTHLALSQAEPACPTAPSVNKPCIDKIDPPGWWAALPSPMLLVHGAGLDHAGFQVSGTGVRLARTQSSENGHWAFLWLETESAAAQTLTITASSGQDVVHHSYVLAERSHAADSHRGFSSADVLYLVMTDRFADGDSSNNQGPAQRTDVRGWHGGDFAGIEKHADYLNQLGVTALWTTPVDSNAGMTMSYHGYAATDLYAVDPHFGSLADYQHLSSALHQRGIKLVIDLVPNHIGVRHPWVLDPPTPDWFHGTLQHHRVTQSDFPAVVDPHAPRQAWRDVTGGWFTDEMPDLNQENPLVSRYLIDNAIWWVETANIDGIRLDTFPYVGRAFWHDFHATLHGIYPQLTTVGEVLNPDAEVASYFAGGVSHQGIDTGLDTPFDYPLYFVLKDVLTQGKPMTDLARLLRQDALYPHPERLVPLIGTHDTGRFLTEAGGSIPKLKLALGLLLTLRGMPLLYAGDEIAMEGGEDPDNRRDFPGGFPGDPRNAFSPEGRTAVQQDVFAWTAGLTALRSTHASLRSGVQQDLFADENTITFVRAQQSSGCTAGAPQAGSADRLLVVANKATQPQTVHIATEETALAGCTQFHLVSPASAGTAALSDGELELRQPAESIAVYEVR